MTALASSPALPTTAMVFRAALCAFFVFAALKNLSGDPTMAQDFTRWGYAPWFRMAVAAAQLVGAVCLLVPALRLAGVIVLAVILLGAVATHLMHDPPLTALTPAVFLAPLTLVAFVALRVAPQT
jgi:uncharacterized membrane protein YphA (DoxX/SURF4 family)